jgi:hypothetical protein
MSAAADITDPMTAEEFDQFVADGQWTFAKSMPGIPHEYVVADWYKGADSDDPVRAGLRIWDEGERAQWPSKGRGKYVNNYLEHTDAAGVTWSYWVLWPIINRAKHPLVPQNEVKALDGEDSRVGRNYMPKDVMEGRR